MNLRCENSSNRSNNIRIKKTEVGRNEKEYRKSNRCISCGGWGHSKPSCPTKENRCWGCGSTEHKLRNCHFKLIRVNKIDIVDESSEVSDTETQENDEENYFEETTTEYNLAKISITINEINLQKPCSCRFKDNCLKCLVDSGATGHVTNDKSILKNSKPLKNVSITGALKTTQFNTITGDVSLLLNNNTSLLLKNVTYVPNLKNSLIISEPKLIDDGMAIIKGPKNTTISKNGLTVSNLFRNNNHFFLHAMLKPNNNLCINSLNISPSDLSHYRLGHVNNLYLERTGLQPMKQFYCLGCAAGKLTESRKGKSVNYNHSELFKATAPYLKLHVDTMGPLSTSIQGYKYASLLVCNFSNFITPILTKSKSNISGKIIKLLKKIKKNHNTRVKCIFSDRGTEFSTLDSFCDKKGIKREYSNIYFPSENGKVERYNRTVMSMVRTFLAQANISIKFWCYCLFHSCRILNIITKKKDCSPYEIVFNKKPQVKNIRMFGSRGHALLSTKKNKFSRTTPIIYLGRDQNSPSHLCFNPKTKKIQRFRTITLDEIGTITSTYEHFVNITSKSSKYADKLETSTYNIRRKLDNTLFEKDVPTTDIIDSSEESDENDQPGKVDESNSTLPPSFTPVSSSSISDSKNRIGDFNITPKNIIHEKRNRKQRVLNLEANSTITDSTIPPRSYHNIKSRSDAKLWYDAYQKEIDSIETIGSFDIVPRPPTNIKVIPLAEVFKCKTNMQGDWIAKARICANDATQRSNYSSTDTRFYAPKQYQQIVGIINYITQHGRPEVSYAVHVLSRHMSAPTADSLSEARRTLRYLFDSKDLILKYDAVKLKNDLKMFVDSSFANGPGRLSVYGFIIFLNDNLIVARSKLEPVVVNNSTEAEYVGISLALRELKGIFIILQSLDVDLQTFVYVDNQPAMRMILNDTAAGRNRYLDTRFQFAKQELKAMKAELVYVKTEENLADVMTKMLQRNKINMFNNKVYHL
eukprot:augustus_masked-scaffold_8-processed-gene-11.44-mRNA-1 protein AED:1.00 eAED:1.00 QI:0/0/0/0/1/1/2/0/980